LITAVYRQQQLGLRSQVPDRVFIQTISLGMPVGYVDDDLQSRRPERLLRNNAGAQAVRIIITINNRAGLLLAQPVDDLNCIRHTVQEKGIVQVRKRGIKEARCLLRGIHTAGMQKPGHPVRIAC
jgi:hypothetical protein